MKYALKSVTKSNQGGVSGMCTKWIEYKGQKILYQDFSHHGMLDIQKIKDEFAIMQQFILAEPPGSVRVLADFRNGQIMKDLLDEMIQHATSTQSHIRKIAAVGCTGSKRLMLDMVVRMTGQPMTFFNDPESAQQWLIE